MAVVMNVKVELRLRMDEDNIWMVNGAFFKGSDQLKVN